MWEDVFFGVLQGLTEFLPVSSSGHLYLLARIFHSPEETFLLVLAVHGATLLSIATVFWKDLNPFVLLRRKQLILKVLVALLPLVVTGLFFKSLVVNSFKQEFVVSLGFLVTGFLLLSLVFKKPSNKPLTFMKAFLIGLAQALAVLPGFSRSGLTLWAGLYLGLSPARAAFFSFLIALPAIFGALLFEVLSRYSATGPLLEPALSNSFIWAFFAAYISGTLALLVVLKLLALKKLYLFGFYLIPLGSFLLLF